MRPNVWPYDQPEQKRPDAATLDGGPAFPYSALDPAGPSLYKDNEGMTLRDYFAARAMSAIWSGNALAEIKNVRGDDSAENAIAQMSYSQADAMLKARSK
jgi:hypothetical protein